MYLEFVEHPKMVAIRSRTVWVHVDVPGQGQDAPDLPTELVSLSTHSHADCSLCISRLFIHFIPFYFRHLAYK